MSHEIGLVHTLVEMEAFYRDNTEIGAIIELINKSNDILDEVPWMESNQSDGHKTRIRTGLPEVYWRRLYQGVPDSKSKWTQVKETTGLLEARMKLDIEEVRLYGDRCRAFRASESLAFTEAMRQKVAATLFYGDNNIVPDEFNGFVQRYPLSRTPGQIAPHVIDAGAAAGAEATSLWLVSWGPQRVHGIYPKGSMGGLSHEDLGQKTVFDDEGREFEAVVDKYTWHCGLTVRDWRAVVRIAGLQVENLTKEKGEAGFIDLHRLTIRAKNMMPEAMRNQATWYANSDVMTALELQASDAGNVQLQYGEYFSSKAVPVLHGRPVRQCDAILSTEIIQ